MIVYLSYRFQDFSRDFADSILKSAASSRIVVLCALTSSAISRIAVVCALKSAATSRMAVLCALKSAVISWSECPRRRGLRKGCVSRSYQAADPLHSHYINKFPQNVSTESSANYFILKFCPIFVKYVIHAFQWQGFSVCLPGNFLLRRTWSRQKLLPMQFTGFSIPW